MGGGSAEVEPLDRGTVVGESRYGPAGEELIHRHRALENISTCQIKRPFEVERRQDLPGEHGALKVRRILVQERKTTIGKTLSQIVPGGTTQFVGGILHKDRHEVFARRGHSGIDDRWNRAFQNGSLRWLPVLRLVERSFDVVLVRADVDGPAMVRARLQTGAGEKVR